MNKLLLVTKNFDEKMDLLYCLDRAESKKQWHFKHPNFSSKDANTILQLVRNIPRKDQENYFEKYQPTKKPLAGLFYFITFKIGRAHV